MIETQKKVVETLPENMKTFLNLELGEGNYTVTNIQVSKNNIPGPAIRQQLYGDSETIIKGEYTRKMSGQYIFRPATHIGLKKTKYIFECRHSKSKSQFVLITKPFNIGTRLEKTFLPYLIHHDCLDHPMGFQPMAAKTEEDAITFMDISLHAYAHSNRSLSAIYQDWRFDYHTGRYKIHTFSGTWDSLENTGSMNGESPRQPIPVSDRDFEYTTSYIQVLPNYKGYP